MSDQDEKDRKFARILQDSKLEISSPGIEQAIMFRIYTEARSRDIRKHRRLSFLCMAMEILLGLSITFTMIRFHTTIFGISPIILIDLFQVGFFILIFFQWEQFFSPKNE